MSAESQIDGYWNPDDPFDPDLGKYTEYSTKTYKPVYLPTKYSLDAMSVATSVFISKKKFDIPVQFYGWTPDQQSTLILGSLYSTALWGLDSIDEEQATYIRTYIGAKMFLDKSDIEVLNLNELMVYEFISKKVEIAYAEIEKAVAILKAKVLKKFPQCEEKKLLPVLTKVVVPGMWYKTWVTPQWQTKYSE